MLMQKMPSMDCMYTLIGCMWGTCEVSVLWAAVDESSKHMHPNRVHVYPHLHLVETHNFLIGR